MAAAVLLLPLLLAAAVATPASAAARGGEKQTHIQVYLHDVLSGPSPTAVPVARAAVTNSSTFYGLVVVIDDPLTDGPDRNSSKLLGRAQGFYAGAGKETMTLVMNMMLVFHGGEYNGSSVAIMGRNQVFTAVREMPIVGGTGVFRMARGYVQVRTHTLDLNTGDAILQYNLFIKH
ncbi:hypothetical protein ACP4OV_003137 [Aristida adscensionis]